MKISVIIPTLNERDNLPALLNDLRYDMIHEVIISDACSDDGTRDILLPGKKYRFIDTERGRAHQMNAGAAIATGEVLLFLHADSRIDSEALRTIPDILSGKVIAGSFPLKFDSNHSLFRIYEWFSRINWSVFTYGDQGLFIKADTFRSLGGFKEIPIMEDIDLVQRIKKCGDFSKSKHQIITSSRRFMENGIIKQELINTYLVLLFKLGVQPSDLCRFYRYKKA